ncbi:AEC family transporter [Oricola thermophila]|uniref:AEC family transporter n=1 Tax=Oricola thermophila TaxID=2742145 RepID=A0A6N1VAM3_9HYPH|nr:AEC family transporter [Oricola thermophila]QKV17990.1 AEC family transporter [Oricola thermophila]
MPTVFAAILPIFLLILFGQALRRLPLFNGEFWRGLDVMGFYVLYPALLFVTIVRADFSALAFSTVVFALAFAGIAIALFTLALWPVLRDRARLSRPSFSSIFQTTVRWNGFLAFAVAEKLFPPEGAAMVALVMAVLIIPINVESVAVVAWFTEKAPNVRAVARKIAVNPLVLAAAAALFVRALPFPLPDPAMEMLDLVARAALGMGLMAIGAGLRPQDALRPNKAVLLAVVNKLVIFPAMVIGAALALGLSGPQLSYLALCAAVPTAMNGYVLARQMGGDAELYAAIATIQTAISFMTIPLALAVVAQFSGG